MVNEFFPFDRERIVELAQKHHNRVIEADADRDSDRLVCGWLADHAGDIPPEARDLLDLAWTIIEESFVWRSDFDVVEPRFQVQSWDAGWAQINAMVFGTKRFNDDLYKKYYEQWRDTRSALGHKIAHAAMDAGVI